jgi:quercetin dioxygenase-like cupin family protein
MITSDIREEGVMASLEIGMQWLPAGGLDINDGRPMPNDNHFIYKVSAEDSQGRFVLLQGGLAPRMLIAPHVHSREDEMSIVIKGRLGARVGEKEYSLGPGGVLLKPRNIVHAMWNPTDEPSVVFEYITPGAYVSFFEEVAALPGGWRGDQSRVRELATRYGQQFVETDWVSDVITRFGLRV